LTKIKGIIFDVDGVIFDTERMSSDFWTITMAKYGYEMGDNEYSQVMGRNREGIISGLEEIYKDSGLDFATIANEKTEAMVAQLDAYPIPVLPGVFEMIEYMNKRGYKRGIATSTRKIRAEKRLKKENVYEHFDAYMYGDEVAASKPNPEIFLKVADKLGLKPEECLVLEDSPSGVEAAHRGGFRCINVVGIKEPTQDMIDHTEARLNNLLEVIDWLEENNR